MEELKVSDVAQLFERARAEMYLPPLTPRVGVGGDRVQVIVRRNMALVTVPHRLLVEPEGGPLLLWYFRHYLAHIHYCPYNLRTVHALARAAYGEVRRWDYAYNAVRLFSDLQVDLLYLPLRYGREPLHLVDEFYRKPKGLDALRYSACRHVYKFLREHGFNADVMGYGAILAEIVLSYRPWTVKVRAVASILRRLKDLGRMGRLRRRVGGDIPLSDDLEADFLGEARGVMSHMRGGEEAREFFEHWIEGRIDIEGLREELKKALKSARVERRGRSRVPRAAADRGRGEEPELPSTLSSPLRKLRDFEEVVWRALWYRARAEDLVVKYATWRKRRKTWAIYAYPDLWTVEDDIEDLDLEASLEEGPLIPEETTLRPVNVPSPSGEVLAYGKSPTALVVLDTSRSMTGSIEEAAIAAFTAYLSAKRMGGRTAVINFSTKHLTVGWEEPDVRKELALAVVQGELTILPLTSIEKLLRELDPGDMATIVIVTDCGWQNLREALGFLEEVASRGHRVAVLHIEGWKYPKSVDAVVRSKHLTLYRVRDPSTLKYITLAETSGSSASSGGSRKLRDGAQRLYSW